MKHVSVCLLLLLINVGCSLKKDIIALKLPLKEYEESARKNLGEQYVYTTSAKDSGEYPGWKAHHGCRFITEYNPDELHVKAIPEFKLLKDFKFQGNVLDFLDFHNENINSLYNIYDKQDKFVHFETTVEVPDYLKSPLMFDCIMTEPIGSNILTMMKLRLQDKFFTFKIDGLTQHLFIVEKGRVYAVSKPMLDGTYQKMEINKFFAKQIGYGGIEYLTDSLEDKYKKKYKFTPSKKYYKNPYFFTVNEVSR